MAGALILNQYGGPRCVWPERLSSTNIGVPGAWSQSEEDGGGDKAGALILNQYGGPRCVWPERLSSTNMGSQVRGLNLKKTEAGTRPEHLSSTSMESQVRGVNLKKTEAGTRPEHLS